MRISNGSGHSLALPQKRTRMHASWPDATNMAPIKRVLLRGSIHFGPAVSTQEMPVEILERVSKVARLQDNGRSNPHGGAIVLVQHAPRLQREFSPSLYMYLMAGL